MVPKFHKYDGLDMTPLILYNHSDMKNLWRVWTATRTLISSVFFAQEGSTTTFCIHKCVHEGCPIQSVIHKTFISIMYYQVPYNVDNVK